MPRTRCCTTCASGTTWPGWASRCAATIRASRSWWRKARGFDAADRRLLLGLIGELLAGVLPRFRALADAGRCELAVSPYSHPILPLLLDFAAAREGEPACAAAATSPHYPGGAERVAWHLQQAVRCFERVFGRAPRGCWPSEGAISDGGRRAPSRRRASTGWPPASACCGLAGASPACQVPGDDRSGRAAAESRASRCRAASLPAIFRHDGMSDLIGFTYSKLAWRRCRRAFRAVNSRRWPSAPRGAAGARAADRAGWRECLGVLPLQRLVFPARAVCGAGGASASCGWRRCRRWWMSSAQRASRPRRCRSVRAGSWVYGTLSTWMGDAGQEPRLGSAVRGQARLRCGVVAAGASAQPSAARAEQQLAACEASDWFWWFGDYNPAGAVRDFDELFRHQLTSLYRSLDLEPPADAAAPHQHRPRRSRGRRRDAALMSAERRVLSRRRAGVLLPASALRQGNARRAWAHPARRLHRLAGRCRVLRVAGVAAGAGRSQWLALLGALGSRRQSGAAGCRRRRIRATTRTSPPGALPQRAGCDDYALFEALSAEQGGAPWWHWPAPLRDRDAGCAGTRPQQRLRAAHRWRWRARSGASMRSGARCARMPPRAACASLATCPSTSRRIRWPPGPPASSSSSMPDGRAAAVAGVPPDYFAADGQLWGNPLYDWDAQQRDGFAFWLRRLALQAERFDLLRIDHFRALEAYWAVPARRRTAREGEWRKAPGHELLQRVAARAAAAGTGGRGPGRDHARGRRAAAQLCACPACACCSSASMAIRPIRTCRTSTRPIRVVYTGTHDNDTTAGWYAALAPDARDLVRRYLGRADHEVRRCAAARRAVPRWACWRCCRRRTCLHLGSEARLNRPGTVDGQLELATAAGVR